MPEMVLATSDDLVARLAHEGDPVRAVVELVWNAVDAEGTGVVVSLERDVMDAISAVRIADDGHGIAPEEVEATFGRIGNSWKKTSKQSKNGKRHLHGKLGEGRLRAFALGSRVVWESRCADTAGLRQVVTITGSRSDRHRFTWDVEPATDTRTGTTVIAYNDEQRSLGVLETDTAIATLRSHFAPVLLHDHTLAVTYQGAPLDPKEEILRDTTVEVGFAEGATEHACQVRIIEWRSGKHRAIYFGADKHHFVHEEPGIDIEGQYPYSAYITWEGLTAGRVEVLGLGDMAESPVGDLWRSTRQAIREHFTARRRERRREQVEMWKATGVYPYRGTPKTVPERIERALFDIVSGTLVPHISKRRDDARLTLALLRDALQHDPYKLTRILHEVVSLKPEDREALIRLLGETTMSAIIRSANLVTSRHKFLVGLEHLLFDPVDSPEVGERDHLHKILERELWIFGEAYHLMSSERGLTELVRTHLRLEGKVCRPPMSRLSSPPCATSPSTAPTISPTTNRTPPSPPSSAGATPEPTQDPLRGLVAGGRDPRAACHVSWRAAAVCEWRSRSLYGCGGCPGEDVLLRSMSDKGVVAILDPCFATACYGRFPAGLAAAVLDDYDPELVRAALKRLDAVQTS